ncbi:hypothetical protein ATANTOWER_010705 [Ataeniobius toweri]|uniref:Dynein regulatory complex subunit 4 n=1 Tax=Ataeniobius toweri TaxID=208326 RepID=A0ABU7CJV1_9TELE|nr:hypothetical protein [Ataeniobius toweri]
MFQLWETLLHLQEELQGVRKEKSFFQLERDKSQAALETSKNNLEEAEMQLKNKRRERAEAEERHRLEISVYKQKKKHVLSEQQNTISEEKMDAVSSYLLLQNQNTESDLKLLKEIQDLQADSREKRLQEDSSIKQLKLKNQTELMKLNKEYERRIQGMEVKKIWTMRYLEDTYQRKQSNTLNKIETQMKHHIEFLNMEHNEKMQRMEETLENFQVSKKNLASENILKGELKKLEKEEVQLKKRISTAQQENHCLNETLQEVQQKLSELHGQVEEHKHSKEYMEKYRAQQKVVEKELRDLTVEHELLLQAFQKVQEERDELLKRQTESILDIQQRSGLKKILLQKKLAAVTETLEKKEAQLSAALSVCSIEPTARSNAVSKLDEILESKQISMDALQQDLDLESQEYEQLLHSWKAS